jgi:stage II sporulation protein AA (anti-sigma F factor antagonist)
MTSAHFINRLTVVADAARSGRVRVRLIGELDFDETERVQSAVAAAIERWAPAHVALDATGLTFLDSAGIRALLECRELAERAGAGLSVEGVSPIVHQVLSITELLEHLGVTVTAPTEGP